MIGLGVAIDYSLFVVSRFREEIRRRPAPDAPILGFRALVEAARAEIVREWGSRLTNEQRDLLEVLAGSRAAALYFG